MPATTGSHAARGGRSQELLAGGVGLLATPAPRGSAASGVVCERVAATVPSPGHDLSLHGAAHLDSVAAELGDRPEKQPAFGTPVEQPGSLLLERSRCGQDRWVRRWPCGQTEPRHAGHSAAGDGYPR